MKPSFIKKYLPAAIVSVLAFCLLVYPVMKFIQMYESAMYEKETQKTNELLLNLTTFSYKNAVAMTDRYESDHFVYYFSRNYMTNEEINAYKKWVENRRKVVIKYFQYDEISDDMPKIEIFVLNKAGTSFSHGAYFVVYNIKSGLEHTVHEMTHSLDYQIYISFEDFYNKTVHKDALNNFFFEQTAVLSEEKFGAGMAFPNYGMPIESILYDAIRRKIGLDPFKELVKKETIMNNNDLKLSERRYLAAGSFGKYLNKKYGIETHKKVLAAGYQGAYGKSLSELEQEWHDSLQSGILIQALLFILAGLEVLFIAHLCIRKFKAWIIPLLLGSMALLAWGYFYNYNGDEFILIIAAIFISICIGFWKKKVASVALWTLGSFALLFGLLLPALDTNDIYAKNTDNIVISSNNTTGCTLAELQESHKLLQNIPDKYTFEGQDELLKGLQEVIDTMKKYKLKTCDDLFSFLKEYNENQAIQDIQKLFQALKQIKGTSKN
ncbi:MAG: hypothetical protein GY760_04735 [Deltaproteobacteria bacterium]|nr:hypothetical protein [Deltaproteobacteria bacterium]